MSNRAESIHGAPAEGASRSTESTKKGSSGGNIIEQVPPDVRLRIFSTSDLIRVVVLGSNGVSNFLAHTEYWRWASSPTFTSTLTLASELIPVLTASALDTFLDGVSQSNQFTAPQNTTQGDWTQGTRTVPANRTGYLYWMTDPDNSAAKIGVLFEKDNQTSDLKAVVWYKKAAPSNGLAFVKKTFSKTLTQVSGTNPTAIEAGTWYHILMGS
ncbi:hypothetical protein WME99_38820 [Sorangium sp. So ce136]|uniref:hypothetical protein n=1 Tax=Sorangium sp. So ce136 TaxID=3133284 RepID=UPI003F045419